MRRGRAGRMLAALSLLILLTGCWDIKNLQDYNFLTALGFDYQDHEYIVYAQMLDFNSIAKSESGKPSEKVPVWVGIGKGETIAGALNDLYRTSQMPIFYGQINAVVMSGRILQRGVDQALDLIHRYNEMRYTPWLFGTNEPIDQLFSISPFFNFSPIMSVLHQPQESYKQQSLIKPISLQEFAAHEHEPGNALAIPSLTIRTNQWEADGKPRPLLSVNGAYIFQEQSYKGWLDVQRLRGLRWFQSSTNRSPMLIRSAEGKPQAALSLGKPRVSVKPRVRDGDVTYVLHVRLTGYISEVQEALPDHELQRKAEEKVGKELLQTFEEGVKIDADLYSLEHALYRKRNRQWKQLRTGGDSRIRPGSLADVRVEINLKYSGMRKY